MVTTQLTPWHWQEKCEPRDPEDAYRQQLLNIEKKISFSKWLQQKHKAERRRNAELTALLALKQIEAQKEQEKKAEEKQKEEKEQAAAKQKEKKERKECARRQREDAQQRKTDEKREAEVQKREAVQGKAAKVKAKRSKDSNGHNSAVKGATKSGEKAPTFKEWMARKKREGKMKQRLARPEGPRLEPRRIGNDPSAQDAYDAWLARKQLEDRVKQKLTAEEKLERALDEKLLHAKTWQKKVIVCAYSKNSRMERETTKKNHASLLS